MSYELLVVTFGIFIEEAGGVSLPIIAPENTV